MSNPTFAKTHNLIAFLEKPLESDGFEQIVDFINANQIKYALTVIPTIYTSCIKQFWTTVKIKTVNDDVRLQALIDGKKVVISEASIRHDLKLSNAEGTSCLSNAVIFEELVRMGIEDVVKEVIEEMVEVMEIAKIIVDKVSTAISELNATNENPVSAAPTNITTAQPSEATRITDITTAHKAKGIVFHDIEESTTRTASLKSQAKDKGKAKEDLEVLWKIVKDMFMKSQLKEVLDVFLWHTLKVMFKHTVEDNVWKHQKRPQGLARVKN
nr:hypothetical protein [Tanacetum cinerariifolium]